MTSSVLGEEGVQIGAPPWKTRQTTKALSQVKTRTCAWELDQQVKGLVAQGQCPEPTQKESSMSHYSRGEMEGRDRRIAQKFTGPLD